MIYKIEEELMKIETAKDNTITLSINKEYLALFELIWRVQIMDYEHVLLRLRCLRHQEVEIG